MRKAHPRVCGENTQPTAATCTARGSSPRVRGKLDGAAPSFAPVRLIPACAGKTRVSPSVRTAATAHPRVCGENCIWIGAPESIEGSSPRVRGKRQSQSVTCFGYGLIPACAGKTFVTCSRVCSTWAHPRVCGENLPQARREPSNTGSSPRVRGKHAAQCSPDREGGLIPACAGKTWDSPGGADCPGAHPRVCGENSGEAWRNLLYEGSSPRVRGKRYRD